MLFSKRKKKKVKHLKNPPQFKEPSESDNRKPQPRTLPSISTVLGTIQIQDKQSRSHECRFHSVSINSTPPEVYSGEFQPIASNIGNQRYPEVQTRVPQIVIMTPEYPINYQMHNILDGITSFQKPPHVKAEQTSWSNWFNILVANSCGSLN